MSSKRKPVKATPQARRKRHEAAAASPAPDAQKQRDSSKSKRVVGRPWPKGVSGNPGGRRRGSVNLTSQLRARLTQEDAVAIVARLIGLAKAGDLAAVKLLLDRLDGPQSGPLAVAMASTAAAQTSNDPGNVHFYLPQKGSFENAFEGWSPEQLKNMLASLEADGASIRQVGSDLVQAVVDGNGAGHGPAATVPQAPEPAKLPAPQETAAPTAPAPAKPTQTSAEPAGRSISETDLFGDEGAKREQAEIRQSGPPSRPRLRGPRAFFG